MFRIYEYGHRLSRGFGVSALRFFSRTRQLANEEGQQTWIVYVAM